MDDRVSITKDIEISDDIDRDMMEIPSIYAYWAERYNAVARQVEELDLSYAVWMAHKKRDATAQHLAAGGRKDVTETAKENLVIINFKDEFLEQNLKLLDARRELNNIKSSLKALEMKESMLISIGANHRQDRELSRGVSLNNPQRKGEQ